MAAFFHKNQRLKTICCGVTHKRRPAETETKMYEPLLNLPVTAIAALYHSKDRTAVQIIVVTESLYSESTRGVRTLTMTTQR